MAAGGKWASSGIRTQDRRSQGLATTVDLSMHERGSIDAKAFLAAKT